MNQPVHLFKAEFFKAMGHPARLVILEQLRVGEQRVTDLQVALDLDQSSVSQHLAVLRNRQLVDVRKEGATAYYSVRDPLIFQLLDIARQIFNNQLIGTREILQRLADESESRGERHGEHEV